jgi:Zn-dependent protease with chaperone function
MADEIFRSSLHKPSYLILFQPLVKNKRLEGHTLSKGIMEPIGMGLAGGVILLMQYFGIFTLPKLSIFILVFVSVWLFISWMVSNDYKDLLQRVLKNRLLTKRNVNYSKDEMNILKTEKLHSDDPLERTR